MFPHCVYKRTKCMQTTFSKTLTELLEAMRSMRIWPTFIHIFMRFFQYVFEVKIILKGQRVVARPSQRPMKILE